MTDGVAPGQPGLEPRWTSSAKSGVGTAASGSSRVWFTLSHGIVNEVYYPRVDMANTRDMGFLVADGRSYFSEEKRDCQSAVELIASGIPGFHLRNTAADGRYTIEKTVITHPHIDVLLQHITFRPAVAGLRLFALLAPHIANRGSGNDGWVGEYKGTPMLFAHRDDITLALACSTPFAARSVGYVGVSDGWQDVSAHYGMTWQYEQAPSGNIALTAEINLAAGNEFTVALAFGESPMEAGQAARLALEQSFEHLESHFIGEWVAAGRDEHGPGTSIALTAPLVPVSLAVLRAHESKRVPGGFVASLSIPWGNEHGDDDLGGYHLVWPRDLVETASGLLAAGDTAAARRAFHYLMATQEADGRWPQNMWLEGTPYWPGIQMDEVAFPILLADQLRRKDALGSVDAWPAVRRAAAYLVQNGPVTPEDRWEEDAGYSPFTLAVEVAALVVAADFADTAGAHSEADYLRETADYWNSSIERWTYVRGSDLARSLNIDGYYVRLAPGDAGDESVDPGILWIKNRPASLAREPVAAVVSPDALALVRFGLRRADDPRVLATIRAIDDTLKTQTATGPVWHRYNDDGYGEHEDGSGFDGTGVGRGWPLLAGERAHYELAAGQRAAAEALLATMERQAGIGGLLPEQVWDTTDIPARELFNGRPSGSAMPLAWAHAEYLKLARSLADGAVFDTPPQVAERYLFQEHPSDLACWRFNNKLRSLTPGARLRLETLMPGTVVWTADQWHTRSSAALHDTGLGVYILDIPTEALAMQQVVEFTFHWASGNWEGQNFDVVVQQEPTG